MIKRYDKYIEHLRKWTSYNKDKGIIWNNWYLNFAIFYEEYYFEYKICGKTIEDVFEELNKDLNDKEKEFENLAKYMFLYNFDKSKVKDNKYLDLEVRKHEYLRKGFLDFFNQLKKLTKGKEYEI